ncbi:MAG: hypothetical protein WC458_00335 [Patescibacteria group bacterium]|jgi:hypothetical protein
MLLILQIILTVVAWKRGYKAWALIPIVVAVSVGLIIGANGGDPGSALVLDIIVGVVLLLMIFLSPRSKKIEPESPANSASMGAE